MFFVFAFSRFVAAWRGLLKLRTDHNRREWVSNAIAFVCIGYPLPNENKRAGIRMVRFALLLVCLLSVGFSPVIETKVDVIERNNFYDDCGRLVFVQFIFWTFNNDASRYDIIAWRLDKGQFSFSKGSVFFHDGERLRRVRFQSFRETWTQYDPELIERAILSTEDRKELGQ